jgi:hypothetical protein
MNGFGQMEASSSTCESSPVALANRVELRSAIADPIDVASRLLAEVLY